MSEELQSFDITDYQTKADAGDAEAQYQLGICYAQGKGVEKNLAQSARYWLLAGKQQHAYALIYLGKLFEKGVGVPQDFGKAFQCYQSACTKNIAEAQFCLAMLYLQGLGVAQDEEQAVQLLHQSAEQQYQPAIQSLQQLKNKDENLDNNTVAAERCFHQGVENLQTNIAEAVSHFAKSAQQNFAKAQYNLGLAYLFSLGGMAQDKTLAIENLQKSAEQDFRPAHFVLAWLYQQEKNFEQAVLHYQKAGELGHAQAQYFLFKLYETGNGVAKDDDIALSWLRQSAKQGYGLAYQRLEQLIP